GVQSFYAVWDRGEGQLTRARLQPQALLDGFPEDVRVPTDRPVDYAGAEGPRQYGWYLDLPAPGERVVSSPVVRGGLVLFHTMIPSLAPCAFGGRGWLMALRIANGGRPRSPAIDLDGDGRVGPGDVVHALEGAAAAADIPEVAAPGGRRARPGLLAGTAFLGDRAYLSGSGTMDGAGIEVRAVRPLGDARTGRLSWGQLGP
ncbi:MAG: hypothetical protein D6809_02225, partial [Gammaproteobacteria bacterium]